MARATDTRSALIVAHGSPSSPDEPECAIRRLAGSVQNFLPDWSVSGATLAGRGTLEAALAAVTSPPLVYPLFMSDGWFVNTALPRRLYAIKGAAREASILVPLGLDPELHNLCLTVGMDASARYGFVPSATTLILAAHGSPSDPRPRLAAQRAARHIEAQGTFRKVRLGFVDEPPELATAARTEMPAICLPFFAMRAGHVKVDIPAALEEAEFDGHLTDPIGTHEGVPGIIAGALSRALLSRAA